MESNKKLYKSCQNCSKSKRKCTGGKCCERCELLSIECVPRYFIGDKNKKITIKCNNCHKTILLKDEFCTECGSYNDHVKFITEQQLLDQITFENTKFQQLTQLYTNLLNHV